MYYSNNLHYAFSRCAFLAVSLFFAVALALLVLGMLFWIVPRSCFSLAVDIWLERICWPMPSSRCANLSRGHVRAFVSFWWSASITGSGCGICFRSLGMSLLSICSVVSPSVVSRRSMLLRSVAVSVMASPALLVCVPGSIHVLSYVCCLLVRAFRFERFRWLSRPWRPRRARMQ